MLDMQIVDGMTHSLSLSLSTSYLVGNVGMLCCWNLDLRAPDEIHHIPNLAKIICRASQWLQR